MHGHRVTVPALATLAQLGLFLLSAPGQGLAPEFSTHYTLRDVGLVSGLSEPAGVAFKPGAPDVLLLRVPGQTPAQHSVRQVTVTRDAAGHISGFTGTASLFVLAPSANLDTGRIDGSLAFGPGDILLYTSNEDPTLGQIKAGSMSVNRRVDLAELGIVPGGSLAVVPAGLPGAGRLKVLGEVWTDATLTADATGTFDIEPGGRTVDLGTDGSGVAYVAAGTPGFPRDSVVVSSVFSDAVFAFEVDANGDPLAGTKRQFVTNLTPLSYVGLCRDGASGDFLLVTETGRVLVVGRFVANPPVVAIVRPTAGARFSSNEEIEVEVEAHQPNGSISSVSILVDNVVADTLRQAPFRGRVSGLTAGNHELRALAVAGNGLSSTSNPVSIIITNPPANLPPIVVLTNPTSNSVLTACSSTILSATAKDPDDPSGAVARVEFFVDGIKLAESTQPPYLTTWTSLAAGSHTITARATDFQGATTTTTPGLTVTVLDPLPNHLVGTLSLVGSRHLPLICLAGLQGRDYTLEATTNRLDWTFVTNFYRTNISLYYIDTQSSNYPIRFFRARLLE